MQQANFARNKFLRAVRLQADFLNLWMTLANSAASSTSSSSSDDAKQLNGSNHSERMGENATEC